MVGHTFAAKVQRPLACYRVKSVIGNAHDERRRAKVTCVIDCGAEKSRSLPNI